MSDRVRFGIERLVEEPACLRGQRFGLLMNQASVDGRLRYASELLAQALPGQLAAIFSPQHGVWGEQQANMIESPHALDPQTGVRVYSLYSEVRRPTREMLAELDVLLIDLQDVGTRVYTFAWTIQACLAACAEADVRVLVLDRPNPLGRAVEGPLLAPGYESFVGGASIPMRHGLTLGELARLMNAELEIGADLDVLTVEGLAGDEPWSALGRDWVAPSPNVPNLRSVLLYPGQVLLEGTNLSEGRGTTAPFEVCGAPYLEPHTFAAALAEFELPGVYFRPLRFLPTFDKWKGQSCGGLALHVTDARAFRPYRTSVALLAAARRGWPEAFAWLPPPYEYETEKMPIDILSGSAQLRETLDAGRCRTRADLDVLAHLDARAWQARVGAHLLYP